MGLDMYLSARLYACDMFAPEAATALEPIAAKFLPPRTNYSGITIETEVCYWRKANQIHNWFVNNVQNGEDDCGRYGVSVEQLRELRDTCYKVLKGSVLVPGNVNNGWTYSQETGMQDIVEAGQVVLNKTLAEELLPTTSGFFFGGTDYDQYYIDDLKDTIEQLDGLFKWLDEHKVESKHRPGEFYHEVDLVYHSSW